MVIDASARMKPPENTGVLPAGSKNTVVAESTRMTPGPAPIAVAETRRPLVQRPSPATTPAPVPKPAGPPPPPTPAPSPAAASTQTAAASPPAAAQTWGIDKPKALQYLSELLSVLEHPTKARKTNAYLTGMNVKGSLFQPALQMMQDYPEIDVSRVDWTDTGTPGVLRIHGNVMLQAKSPNIPAVRFANFQFTAEFWGTAGGTVLGELNLKESQ